MLTSYVLDRGGRAGKLEQQNAGQTRNRCVFFLPVERNQRTSKEEAADTAQKSYENRTEIDPYRSEIDPNRSEIDPKSIGNR